MDRTARAVVRLPPVARLICPIACVLLVVLAGGPAYAFARALPPPPQRMAAVWGRPGWSPEIPGAGAALPLARLGAAWAGRDPVALPTALRSPHG